MAAELPDWWTELPDWVFELPDWVLDALRREVSAHPRKAMRPSLQFRALAGGVINAAGRRAMVRLDDLVFKPDTGEVGIGNGDYRKAEPGKEIYVLYELLREEAMRLRLLPWPERKAEIERFKRAKQ
jgi:hypothetical protein